MCHYYIVHCTGTAGFVLYEINNLYDTQCSDRATIHHDFSTTFSHQILCNIVMDFDLCWQNPRKVTLFWYTSHRVNLPTDVDVRVVTMCTLLYSSHAEYDNNNDITSPQVSTATSHISPCSRIWNLIILQLVPLWGINQSVHPIKQWTLYMDI